MLNGGDVKIYFLVPLSPTTQSHESLRVKLIHCIVGHTHPTDDIFASVIVKLQSLHSIRLLTKPLPFTSITRISSDFSKISRQCMFNSSSCGLRLFTYPLLRSRNFSCLHSNSGLPVREDYGHSS